MSEHQLSHGQFESPCIETPTGDPNHTVDQYPHYDLIKEALNAAIQAPDTPEADKHAARKMQQIPFGSELDSK
jgi:hypothetical protein